MQMVWVNKMQIFLQIEGRKSSITEIVICTGNIPKQKFTFEINTSFASVNSVIYVTSVCVALVHLLNIVLKYISLLQQRLFIYPKKLRTRKYLESDLKQT